MPHVKLESVVQRADAAFEGAINRLSDYLRIPAISIDPAHKEDVRRLALTIKADLSKLGFQKARLLELDDSLNAHPCVAAEWMKKPGAPTVLIYGHLDLQPVKGEPWSTPPHEATRKMSSTGERLYARGAADDMGGWVSHLVALQAWLDETGELPCNVKLLIEGEEEIGSPNLEAFMDKYPEAFESDVMVLTDCENPSVDLPGLTISLRGILELEVTCSSSTSDVHSGIWGNAAPDPAMSLVKLLARLVDDDGRMNIGRVPVSDALVDAARKVPFDGSVVKAGAHLKDGVTALPERGLPLASWISRQPAVTVLSTTFPAPGREKNAIRHTSSAILSVRVAPGQTKDQLLPLIVAALSKDPPGGVQVTVTERPGGASSWDYVPKGEAFAAADRAYEKAWGHKLVPIGLGGSIPFVALFGRRYGDLPLILNGVMDPETTAHGPNESLHLGVFKKAVRANVYLLDELAALPKPKA